MVSNSSKRIPYEYQGNVIGLKFRYTELPDENETKALSETATEKPGVFGIFHYFTYTPKPG